MPENPEAYTAFVQAHILRKKTAQEESSLPETASF